MGYEDWILLCFWVHVILISMLLSLFLFNIKDWNKKKMGWNQIRSKSDCLIWSFNVFSHKFSLFFWYPESISNLSRSQKDKTETIFINNQLNHFNNWFNLTKIPNILWFQPLKCEEDKEDKEAEDASLSSLFWITVNWITLDYRLLVGQNKQCEHGLKELVMDIFYYPLFFID